MQSSENMHTLNIPTSLGVSGGQRSKKVGNIYQYFLCVKCIVKSQSEKSMADYNSPENMIGFLIKELIIN